MSRWYFVLAAALTILGGGRAPGLPEAVARGVGGTTSEPPGQLARLLLNQGYIRVPLERVGPGYRAVTAVLEGQKVRFLVDTGSPSTWFDLGRMRRFKLVWNKQDGIIRRIDAHSDASNYCEVAGLEISGMALGRVRAFSIDTSEFNDAIGRNGDDLVDGMLGSDVLSRHQAIMDLPNDEIFLKPHAPPPDPGKPEPGATVERSIGMDFPLFVPLARILEIDRVRFYFSEDGGKSWEFVRDYRPSAQCVSFVPPHSGPYCFALQMLLRDGRREPPDISSLIPLPNRNVYVSGEQEAPRRSPALPKVDNPFATERVP